MLLLYRVRRKWRARGWRIYIPLCFYFIAAIPLWTIPMYFIYIPLCFYFIGRQAKSFYCCNHIYIPLCFYFIRTFPIDSAELKNIYIPLCFYFIRSRRWWHYIHQWYLHSTMLLLYPCDLVHWLYALSIYIPLCFYFITIVLIRLSRAVAFTFHYASTLSSGATSLRRMTNRFTFHYASTLSHHARCLVDIIVHLHSTMLLLYPDHADNIADKIIIYIPLCFYFI